MAFGEGQGAANTTSYASCETSPQLTVRVAVVITREVVKLPESITPECKGDFKVKPLPKRARRL